MNCSFCGRNETECAVIISAHLQANICDFCVEVCMREFFKKFRLHKPPVTTSPSQTGDGL